MSRLASTTASAVPSLAPAIEPTIYFIGVTTGQSSILRVFPRWAEALGLGRCRIVGVDLPLHASADAYRSVVTFIRSDPLSRGALVTTHKIDLFAASWDLFDEVEELAGAMGELSCISKTDGRLVASAKDPISAGLALEAFVPPRHFAQTGAELFSMGAGGSTIAITWHLMRPERKGDRPSRVVVSNRSAARLDAIREIHRAFGFDVPVEYALAPEPRDNDRVMATLKPGSLVVNATGLGKDAPGSPISDDAVFPQDGLAWELNYRGDLVFLRQARDAALGRQLIVEDGWVYFLHGWTRVIAEVFGVQIPTSGPLFQRLSELAGGPPLLQRLR
jgi:shikimate 5-dehydrogenase